MKMTMKPQTVYQTILFLLVAVLLMQVADAHRLIHVWKKEHQEQVIIRR